MNKELLSRHKSLCAVAHLWSMNIFGYDKLWGPSQRVVTLFCVCSNMNFPDARGNLLTPKELFDHK